MCYDVCLSHLNKDYLLTYLLISYLLTLCDIINFFWLLIDVCFLLLHVSFIFDCLMYFSHYSVLRVRNKI